MPMAGSEKRRSDQFLDRLNRVLLPIGEASGRRTPRLRGTRAIFILRARSGDRRATDRHLGGSHRLRGIPFETARTVGHHPVCGVYGLLQLLSTATGERPT